MATPALRLVEPAPRLEVIPGGRGVGPGKVVALRSDVVEGWLEVQVVADESARFADDILGAVRVALRAIAAGRPGIAGMYLTAAELRAPLVARRARQSATEARCRLAALEPDPAA